jgi:hypothetical protein
MSIEGGHGFDRWLEQQLQQEVANAGGASPSPSQAQYHAAYLQGGLHMSFLSKAGPLASAKGAAALAMAVLAVGAVSAEAAAAGSADPVKWGPAVVNQVKTCKDALPQGQHGIGQCVSAFAKTHGKQVSSEHSNRGSGHSNRGSEHASGARTNRPGHKPTSEPETGD